MPVELVNLRVSLAAKHGDFGLQTGWQAPAGKPFERAELAGCERLVDVWQRHELEFNTPCAGPAVIIDAVATTYVAPGWQALRDPSGCLLLERLVESGRRIVGFDLCEVAPGAVSNVTLVIKVTGEAAAKLPQGYTRQIEIRFSGIVPPCYPTCYRMCFLKGDNRY